MRDSEISLASYLHRLLIEREVTHIFGIPGVHTVELYRDLEAAGLHHITPRHEQAAGFMADGYARASGKPGVCFVISGPGVTNILTAMAQAYADSVPMLVISSVNAHGRMGSGEGWLHEMPDQSAMVSHASAFSRTIHQVDELEKALDDAFSIFSSARPRPVHIEIPINLLRQPVRPKAQAQRRAFAPAAPGTAITAAADMLLGAEKPVILAGGGARAANANIRQLAETLDAPVVMTTNGRGLLPVGHDLAVPCSASLAATRAMIREADVVLAIGTEIGPTDYDMYEDGGFAICGDLIRIDIDPRQTIRPFPAALAIVGDAALTVEALCATLTGVTKQVARDNGDRPETCGAKRAAAARVDRDTLAAEFHTDLQLLDLIRDRCAGSHIVGDSTQYVYAGNLGFEMSDQARYFNSASGFGSLGYGLPAAIGATIASGRRAICLCGDGGFQFSLAEIATARELNAPVLLVLHDNAGYGEIKSYMRASNITPIGVDIYTPDLGRIVEAAGWAVLRPQPGEVAMAFDHALTLEGPVMVYLSEEVRRRPFATADLG